VVDQSDLDPHGTRSQSWQQIKVGLGWRCYVTCHGRTALGMRLRPTGTSLGFFRS
jgi:hypothetical protein